MHDLVSISFHQQPAVDNFCDLISEAAKRSVLRSNCSYLPESKRRPYLFSLRAPHFVSNRNFSEVVVNRVKMTDRSMIDYIDHFMKGS